MQDNAGKSISEQVDFWLNDKRVQKIINSENNVFTGYANPEYNPNGFIELCNRLESLGRLK